MALFTSLLFALYLGGALRTATTWGALALRLWSSARVVLAALVVPLPWLLFKATADPIGSDYGPLTPA
jgi:hypothetical protein